MGTLLPSTIPTPLFLAVGFVIILLGLLAYSFFVTMFAMQIPDVKAQILAQMKRRALVLMHYSNRRAKFYCPKRDGKKQQENTLDLPDNLHTKFDPSGAGLEEVLGKTIMYNFYSKSTNSIPADAAKAVHDFKAFCGEKGILVNEELIDALVVENLDIQGVYTQPLLDRVLKNLPLPIRTEKEHWLDEDTLNTEYNRLVMRISELNELVKQTSDEEELKQIDSEILECNSSLELIGEKYKNLAKLKEIKQELSTTVSEIEYLESQKSNLIDEIDIMTGYLDPDTRKTIYTLTRLKEDLQKRVIREGLFIFPKVQDFVFAASSLNAAGMTEAISIAKSDAIMQNEKDQNGWTMENIAMLVILIIVLLVGSGLAYKMAFG